jgi:hypothetical protein
MQTQAAIRSDAFRVVPTSRPFALAPRPTGRPAFGGRAEANSLDESLQLMGATMSYPRNTEIFGENEPADYVYKVISGSVRTYNILSDGRRQIGGFYMPGDIFGIEFDGEHSSAAEAIADAKVLVVRRKSASLVFCSRWRNARPAAMPSSCRCRARISPTISA